MGFVRSEARSVLSRSVGPSHFCQDRKSIFFNKWYLGGALNSQNLSLDATLCPYKRVCSSVGQSIGQSVHWLVSPSVGQSVCHTSLRIDIFQLMETSVSHACPDLYYHAIFPLQTGMLYWLYGLWLIAFSIRVALFQMSHSRLVIIFLRSFFSGFIL